MNFVLWKWSDYNWQSSYKSEHVNIMADCIRRNYKRPHKIYCVTDDSTGIRGDINIIPMWNEFKELGSCYRRLFAFSAEFAELVPEKFCSIDLDCVITGDLTELLDNAPDFAIMRDSQPPQPYNGSFWVLEPGSRIEVYEQFKADPQGIINAARAKGYTACDQAAIACILGENEQRLGAEQGFYSYKFDIKRKHGGNLPDNARLIAFHGDPKPWSQQGQAIEWVKDDYGYTNRAIIIGGADSVWTDLQSIEYLIPSSDIIAVNDSGAAYEGKLAYWVTLHPEKMKRWHDKRKEQGFDMDLKTIGYGSDIHGRHGDVDEHRPCWRAGHSIGGASGSSGLFAVQVALEEDYEEIILCGVPMNSDKNTFSRKAWNSCTGYRQAWLDHLDKIKGKVYSQSGWTRELLGGWV